MADGDIQATAEELRAKYPGLSEQAIQLLLQRQVRTGLTPLFEKTPTQTQRWQGAFSQLKDFDARRQATAAANKEAMAERFNQMAGGMQQFGETYTERMVGFNALPQIIAAMTNRPLQTMVNVGSPALQKTILQALGPKLGAGAARFVDTALRGGAGKIPALNIGAGLMVETAPSGATNIPENRPQSLFDSRRPSSNFLTLLPEKKPVPKLKAPQMLARIQKSKRRGSTRAKTTPFEKIARGMREF